MFREESKAAGKEQYLTPYFISSFPGCGDKEMTVVENFLNKSKWNLQQVQDFIPLPMTVSGAMYHTGIHPITAEKVYVPKTDKERAMQRALIQPQNEKSGKLIDKAKVILGKKGRQHHAS